jgi:hypothetical protein
VYGRTYDHKPALKNFIISYMNLRSARLLSGAAVVSNRLMTGRELRRQRREAERKARKLEYQQARLAAAAGLAPGLAPMPHPSEPKSLERSGPTGPRSPEGKAISSGNSLKHGLASGRLIIPGEDPAGFEALLDDLMAEHAPANPIETLLVQQMAQSWWLMQRAIRIQNQVFTETRVDTHKLALFLRYQTTYERAFYKALNTLTNLKLSRASKPALSSLRKSEPGFVSQQRRRPQEPEFVSQQRRRQQEHEFVSQDSGIAATASPSTESSTRETIEGRRSQRDILR